MTHDIQYSDSGDVLFNEDTFGKKMSTGDIYTPFSEIKDVSNFMSYFDRAVAHTELRFGYSHSVALSSVWNNTFYWMGNFTGSCVSRIRGWLLSEYGDLSSSATNDYRQVIGF